MHGTIETGFDAEVRRLDELPLFAAELRALAARALSPNVFYEPAFVAAAAPVFGRDVTAGLVWRRGAQKLLVGFFPASIERRRYGLKLPVMVGWTHPYGPLGTPLLDRDSAEAAVAAWLRHLATDKQLPKLLLMPYLPAADDVARVFDDAIGKGRGRSAAFALHRRALLAPEGDRDCYLDRAIAHRKRKELRRQRKRLADAGVLTSHLATEPDSIKSALVDFLALESAGWKGRAGTAAQADDAIRGFVAGAVDALAAEGKAQISRLLLDDRAIAAIMTLQSGDSAWCWKIAYDENFARFSPGVQCLTDVTGMLLANADIARTDSCATTDHPMIDHVWRERLALSDRLICVAPCDGSLFAHVCKMESLRRSAVSVAKRLRNFLRRK